MKEFKEKVAVVTGGASGIGFSLAKRALVNGMKVVIADIKEPALAKAAEELRALGEPVLTVKTDVSKIEDVEALAQQTLDHFGGTHLLFNNAGVGGGGPVWEADLADWEWVLGVNLWGVIHGVKAFTPQMIAQNSGHVINTASIAGLMSAPGTGTYTVSKHAVVALSELLYGDLRNAGANVGVSVLCPSFVNTDIFASERHRPSSASVEKTAQQIAEQEAMEKASAEFFSTALSPDAVASQVFDAIANQQFYILPHPEGSKQQVEKRMRGILENRNPTVTGPEEFPVQ